MRQGQAEAILVAYDIMDADDGQNVRPEHLEGRRKCLGRLLARCRAERSASGDGNRRNAC